MASVITYLQLEVINPGLNQAVVSLLFVREAERKRSPEKGHSPGISLFSLIEMTTYLLQIFTAGQVTVCPSVCMTSRKLSLPALRKS